MNPWYLPLLGVHIGLFLLDYRENVTRLHHAGLRKVETDADTKPVKTDPLSSLG
jgi:hypothetical protein